MKVRRVLCLEDVLVKTFVYYNDIMKYTDINDIPGLLLLIDFEKAFDSISHEFIMQVLDFFYFGASIK